MFDSPATLPVRIVRDQLVSRRLSGWTGLMTARVEPLAGGPVCPVCAGRGVVGSTSDVDPEDVWSDDCRACSGSGTTLPAMPSSPLALAGAR